MSQLMTCTQTVNINIKYIRRSQRSALSPLTILYFVLLLLKRDTLLGCIYKYTTYLVTAGKRIQKDKNCKNV